MFAERPLIVRLHCSKREIRPTDSSGNTADAEKLRHTECACYFESRYLGAASKQPERDCKRDDPDA